MHMMYSYQRLTPEDTELMRDLLVVFGRAFEDEALYQERPPTNSYLRKELSNERCIVLAACDGARVVGGLVAYVLPKFEQERSEIYLYDLAVDERYRRQGIATELIEELRRIGHQVGAWVIFVQADAVDEPAIKLYESLTSHKEAPYHFDIPIKGV